jgi:hypothetical protein
MSKSDYIEAKIIGWLRGTAFGTAPTDIYVSLHTGDPGETGANEHGATAGYERVVGDLDSGTNPASNSAEVAFPEATANYSAPITHFGWWDAKSSGNFLGGGVLAEQRTIVDGAVPRFAAGSLTWTEQ